MRMDRVGRVLSASGILVLSVAAGISVGRVQQAAPAGQAGAAPAPAARGGTPAAINWPSPSLPASPIVLDTAIQRSVRLFVTKGLNQPWSMAFLPDGGILVTERPGRLRIIRNGELDPTPVAGVPAVRAQGLAGLMDLALHPRFSENRWVYLTYHKPAADAPGGGAPANDGARGAGGGGGGGAGTITLARGRWDGKALVEVRDLFSAIPSGNASRIVFGRDGMLYMSVGVGDPPNAAQAQVTDNLAGKVLRLRDDGTVPPDNPFVGRAGYRPEIFTLGHRNPLGLVLNPVTGEIWECEDGPNGGDEVNVLQAGKNYGWPVVSYGRFYAGPRVSERPWQEGMEQPTVFWVPAIAISGITFYTGDKFPTWKNHLFVGGMRTGEVPRSGHLERVDFNGSWEELHREGMLRELQNRIRDVRQGPDGFLYLLTAENDGALMRMEPYTAPAAPAAR